MQESGVQKLGRHLKRLRSDRKLTLASVEALSEDFGNRINKTYLFRVECGKTTPTLPRLHVLSRIYRVRLTSLVDILEAAAVKPKPAYDLGQPLTTFSFDELRTRGIDAERAGDFTRSVMYFSAARDRAILDPPSQARNAQIATAQHDRTIALRNSGDWHLAREEAEDLFEDDKVSAELRDKIRLNLAIIYRRIGQPVLAAHFLEGLIARKNDLAPEILAYAHQEMGSQFLGPQPKQAVIHYSAALSIQKRLKHPLDVCQLLNNIGYAYLNAAEFEQSMRVLESSRAMALDYRLAHAHASAQTLIGTNIFHQGRTAEAKTALRIAITLAREGEYVDLLLRCYYYLWRIATSEHDVRAAHASEASLKFYASRIQEPCEELEAYRKERK